MRRLPFSLMEDNMNDLYLESGYVNMARIIETDVPFIFVLGGIVQLFFTYLVGFPGIGISGFVIGYVISSGITAVLNFLCLVRKFGLRPRFSNWFATPLLASVFSALICNIAYDGIIARTLNEAGAVMVAGTIGLFAYALALSALGTNLSGYIKSLIPKGRY